MCSHPPLICIHYCEAMRRQEGWREGHAWTVFGQFVLLQGCILLAPHCSQGNASQCSAEEEEGVHVEMHAGNQYSAAQLTSHYIVTTPHLATFPPPFQDLLCLKDVAIITVFIFKIIPIHRSIDHLFNPYPIHSDVQIW